MAVLENPTVRAYEDTLHINSLYFPDLPIRADSASIAQYCIENSYTLVSYVSDPETGSRFSNDGGRTYNYYDTVTSQWMNKFGYEPVVVELTYS